MRRSAADAPTEESAIFDSLTACRLYLDTHSLAVEVSGGPDGAWSTVQVEEGGGSQDEQGDDYRGWEWGEQELEDVLHGGESAGECI